MIIQRIPLVSVILLFLLMIVLHIIANLIGLYQTSIVWIDKILHLLAGSAMALFWLWYNQRKEVKTRKEVLYILVFVITLAVVWEIIEFVFSSVFTTYALMFNIYSPSILEAAVDIVANAVGGLIIILFVKKE